MFHYLYVGHFERHGEMMNMAPAAEKGGAPMPLVVRPLDREVIDQLLSQRGISASTIPED